MIAQYSFTSIIIIDDWLSSSKDENILGIILYKIKCIWLKIDIAYSYDKCREENMSKESTFYNDYSPPTPLDFYPVLFMSGASGWLALTLAVWACQIQLCLQVVRNYENLWQTGYLLVHCIFENWAWCQPYIIQSC